MRGLVNGLLHIVHLISCSTIAGREGKDRESEDNGRGNRMERVRIVPGKVSFRAVREARRASLSSWVGPGTTQATIIFKKRKK